MIYTGAMRTVHLLIIYTGYFFLLYHFLILKNIISKEKSTFEIQETVWKKINITVI